MKKRAPRRPRRKVRKGRAGKLSNNTKVDLVAQYKYVEKANLAAGTTVQNYIFGVWSPANSVYASNITKSAEFMAQANLYDEFKISSMTVKWSPVWNANYPVQTDPTPRYWQIFAHTIVDRDGRVPLTTSTDVPNKMAAYDSYKKHPVFKPWSRTIKLKNFWMDCTTPTTTSIGPTTQAVTNAGYNQALCHYLEMIPAAIDTLVGQYEVIFNVQFRGKKPVSFGFDEQSGSVIITPLENFGNPLVSTQSSSNSQVNAYLTCEDGDIKVRAVFDDAEALRANAPAPLPEITLQPVQVLPS